MLVALPTDAHGGDDSPVAISTTAVWAVAATGAQRSRPSASNGLWKTTNAA
jgi:hypothetical protein